MADLEGVIGEELERFGVPGAAVAVVGDGEVVLRKGFGRRAVDHDDPVTDRTLFPIGSTTKAFTATVLGTLVDEGLLDWDVPVREYFPAFRLHDPVATQQVTLRDMLSHRTGLARHDMLMLMYGSGGMSRADLVERLRYLQPNRELREEWQYNNLIYMTAGYFTEVVAGETWEEAVEQRLLAPLGMTNTNFSIDELQRSNDHSRPHAAIAGDIVEVPFRAIEMVGPAGSINSCIADMTQWLTMNLGSGTSDGHTVISPGALEEIHAPAIDLPDASPWDEVKLVGYGLGWVVEDFRGHRVVWHNGGIDGFKALVSFIPQQKIGVVVLANKFPTEAPEAIAYRVFEELLELEPIDWGQRRYAIEEAMSTGAEEAKSRRDSIAKDAPPTHVLEEFAGAYSHPAYGRIAFDIVDGELTVDLHDLEVTLRHRHYNVWDAHEAVHDILIPFVFQIDADGEIARVEAQLEAAVDPIVFYRDPDAELFDPAVLDRLTGSYSSGPLTMEISREDGRLTADLAAMGRFELVPRRKFRFDIKGHEGMSLRFLVGEDGTASEVLMDQLGVFSRSSS